MNTHKHVNGGEFVTHDVEETILFISDVQVQETDLYARMAEDSEIICYDLLVYAYVDGDVYMHKHIFKGAVQDPEFGFYHVNYNAKPEAHRLADRVASAGKINTKHWELIGNLSEMTMTAEERLQEAWSDISDHYEDYYG